MAPAGHLQVGVGVGVSGTEADRESRARIESEVEPICQKIEWNYLLKWTHWDAKFSAKPVWERPTRFAGIEKKEKKLSKINLFDFFLPLKPHQCLLDRLAAKFSFGEKSAHRETISIPVRFSKYKYDSILDFLFWLDQSDSTGWYLISSFSSWYTLILRNTTWISRDWYLVSSFPGDTNWSCEIQH